MTVYQLINRLRNLGPDHLHSTVIWDEGDMLDESQEVNAVYVTDSRKVALRQEPLERVRFIDRAKTGKTLRHIT